MRIMDYLVLYLVIAENIIIAIIFIYLTIKIEFLNRKLKNLSVNNSIAKEENDEWRAKLLEKVKEKISITEQAQHKLNRGEDLVAKFIYSHEDIQKLSEELNSIFRQPLQTIREQYPNLTELDILVICLIGIGMDNDEICTILRMEKRTLYRRRQLIAQRVGMSSTQLELFATTLITDFEE